MTETRFWIASALCLVVFVALGYLVTHAPLSAIDSDGAALRGRFSQFAVILTLSGRSLPLLALGALTIGLFVALRANVFIPIGIFATQLASQGVVEAFKHLFGRLRPDYWLFGKELGFSYPSGHACTAIVFFGSWAMVVAMSPMPRVAKISLIVLLAIWMMGIDFSRLALGAHYVTDVVGGTLIGLSFLFALLALSEHFHIAVHA